MSEVIGRATWHLYCRPCRVFSARTCTCTPWCAGASGRRPALYCVLVLPARRHANIDWGRVCFRVCHANIDWGRVCFRVWAPRQCKRTRETKPHQRFRRCRRGRGRSAGPFSSSLSTLQRPIHLGHSLALLQASGEWAACWSRGAQTCALPRAALLLNPACGAPPALLAPCPGLKCPRGAFRACAGQQAMLCRGLGPQNGRCPPAPLNPALTGPRQLYGSGAGARRNQDALSILAASQPTTPAPPLPTLLLLPSRPCRPPHQLPTTPAPFPCLVMTRKVVAVLIWVAVLLVRRGWVWGARWASGRVGWYICRRCPGRPSLDLRAAMRTAAACRCAGSTWVGRQRNDPLRFCRCRPPRTHASPSLAHLLQR